MDRRRLLPRRRTRAKGEAGWRGSSFSKVCSLRVCVCLIRCIGKGSSAIDVYNLKGDPGFVRERDDQRQIVVIGTLAPILLIFIDVMK